jgi:regulatory protein
VTGTARASGACPQTAAPEAAARRICLRLLARAPRTRAQLAEAVRKRGIPGEAAEAVLSRFSEVGLIDDELFARAWVESRHHGRGLAGRALAAELRQRGVSADNIGAALRELSPDQETATAEQIVARRLAATRGQPLPARIRRVTGVLARKGYSPALAYRLIRAALDDEGADPAAAGIDLDAGPFAAEDG